MNQEFQAATEPHRHTEAGCPGFGDAWQYDDGGVYQFCEPIEPLTKPVGRLSRLAGDVMCLDAGPKAVLRELCEYCDLSNSVTCNPSSMRLALRLGFCLQSVRNHRRALARIGLVAVIANPFGGTPGTTCVHEVDCLLLEKLAAEGRRSLATGLLDYAVKKATANKARKRSARLADAGTEPGKAIGRLDEESPEVESSDADFRYEQPLDDVPQWFDDE